jgi:hypothetical protein
MNDPRDQDDQPCGKPVLILLQRPKCAEEVIISGAAITNDIATSNQYSDGTIATASVSEKQIVCAIHTGRLADSHRSLGQFTTDRIPQFRQRRGMRVAAEALNRRTHNGE